MVDHAQYLLLMAACLLVTLPLELILGVRVYRSPKRLLAALVPGFVIFTLWDIGAILGGHWTYNPKFVTGLHLGPIPIEELVFFAVIPICGLLTYEGVSKVLSLARQQGRLRFRWPHGLVREGYTETRSRG